MFGKEDLKGPLPLQNMWTDAKWSLTKVFGISCFHKSKDSKTSIIFPVKDCFAVLQFPALLKSKSRRSEEPQQQFRPLLLPPQGLPSHGQAPNPEPLPWQIGCSETIAQITSPPRRPPPTLLHPPWSNLPTRQQLPELRQQKLHDSLSQSLSRSLPWTSIQNKIMPWMGYPIV